MNLPRVRYATTSDGVSIAYATVGEGPPVVMLMPFPWTHLEGAWRLPEIRRWHEHFAEHAHLVLYDSRGTGLSDRVEGELSLDMLLLDLDAVVGHLGLERFALMTAPTSGPIAIAYAARHPERVTRLVLFCTFARGAESYLQQLDPLRGIADHDWDLYLETSAHVVIGWSEGEYAHRYADLLRQGATASVVKAYEDLLRTVDVTPLLSSVVAPTLVLHRRGLPQPPIDVARALAAHIPDARLVILEGSSPAPFIGDLESVVRPIEEFLGTRPTVAVSAPTNAAPAPLAILVTDVEGSTALTERLGDQGAREALRAHESIVRDALRAHGGTEIKTMGDGFIASFPSATRALECAVAVQRAMAVAPHELRVRIGVNAGEPIAEGGDLFGTAMNLAARVAASAAGGEILVADVVRQLAAGKGFRFVDRGEVALRGFAAPVRISELLWAETPSAR